MYGTSRLTDVTLADTKHVCDRRVAIVLARTFLNHTAPHSLDHSRGITEAECIVRRTDPVIGRHEAHHAAIRYGVIDQGA
jgi:hypothetical protein